LGLDHLLLRLGQVRFGFLQLVGLVRRVELENHLALLHHFSGFAEIGDMHIAIARHGRGQFFRIPAAQLGFRRYRQGHIAAFHTCGRQRSRARRSQRSK